MRPVTRRVFAMKGVLVRVIRILRLADDRLFAAVAGAAFVAAALIMTWEVVAREGFDSSSSGRSTAAIYLTLFGYMAAMGSAAGHKVHIRVEVLESKMTGRRAVHILIKAVQTAAIVAFATALAVSGIEYTATLKDAGVTSGSSLSVNTWWAAAAIPLGAILLGARSLLEFAAELGGLPLNREEDDVATAGDL
ncbi:MAG: C4-dicarboxylate transporter substrate-binding protein, partial [Subtercola sp.]|nr:C4-dicarboxylate transporter substrate-binding protein [Subtercola sp.]